MITAGEIRKKAESKYHEILQRTLKVECCFPLVLRSDKKLSDDFVLMGREIAEVLSKSKDRQGFGYSVNSEPVKTRKHGIQGIPKSITFESLTDYLKFLGKEKEFARMVENLEVIKTELPQLAPWLIQNPKEIIANANRWPDLVKVCQWFISHFEANTFYIRELPIGVHTKFIEENKGCLRLLLEELNPRIVVVLENDFEKRFGLRYDQPQIRFRSLDKSKPLAGSYDDMSVPLQLFKSNPPRCSRVFIIENKMNFLTFPEIPNAIAIWGKGFAIESLKNTDWLSDKDICYWSDLDVQGFQMLSQLRSYYPQTKSFLMEMEVLEKYSQFIVVGTPTNNMSLPNLSNEERQVYDLLLKNNYRFEQERVHQSYLIDFLNKKLI